MVWLMKLSSCSVVYFGPVGKNASTVMQYFGTDRSHSTNDMNGNTDTARRNPADAILDLCGNPSHQSEEDNGERQINSSDDGNNPQDSDRADLYLQSSLYEENQREGREGRDVSLQPSPPSYRYPYAATPWMQVRARSSPTRFVFLNIFG